MEVNRKLYENLGKKLSNHLLAGIFVCTSGIIVTALMLWIHLLSKYVHCV